MTQKSFILLLVLFLFLPQVIQAQDDIFLPIITKGDCMSDIAIFQMTDGTITIDLLMPGSGIGVVEWRPQTPPILPTYQSSPLSSGRELSSYKLDNPTETIEYNASGLDQDNIIEQLQDARRLLIQGLDYHVVDWQTSLVYLIAKAKCETNTRYALVQMAQMGDDDFPFGQPFASNDRQLMSDMSFVIERGNWLGNIPGTGECAKINSVQDWQYTEFWSVNTTLPVDVVHTLLQTANGDIYAGDLGQIWRSTDNGASWGVNTVLPVGRPRALFQTANGDIYAGDSGQLLRSIDNGASWAVNTTDPTLNVEVILQIANGHIFFGDEIGGIWRSIDGGTSWTMMTDITIAADMIQTVNGDMYAGDAGEIWRSIDNGVTWSINTALPTGTVFSLLQTDNGDIYAGEPGAILRSVDNGASWAVNTGLPVGTVFSLLQTTDDNIYAGESGQIWRSVDNGISWQINTTLPGSSVNALIQTTNGNIYAGEAGQILNAVVTTAAMGGENTCNRDIYIANKTNIGNITHIKIDDGGVFTDIFPITSFPQDLLPAVPVVNDAVYFGQEVAITDTGPFASLVFDIESILTVTGTYTIVWEYWNGAWVTLSVTDNTFFGGVFRGLGVVSVHWLQPSDWATTAVDGVTGYWVRARLSALAGSITPPTQQNRDIYTIVNPYFEIINVNILGDIQSLAQFKIMNQSDADGGEPELWSNRVLTGLRSTSRGSLFNAFINISDEQNITGVTVTTGINATYGDDPTTPTGRRLTYGALAGDTTFVTRVTITISPTIIQDFYGTFHLFLRARQVSGVVGDITTRVQIQTSSGGITFTTPEVTFLGIDDWELLDLDAITIPAGGRSIKPSDLGDVGTITIQAKNDSGAGRDVYYYDLVFIPTDEWAGDFTDQANIDASAIGGLNEKTFY